MPGTFAHIVLVGDLCEMTRLKAIPELTEEIRDALLMNLKFCELGAVSPDYPYLKLLNEEAAGWANVMHYWKTSDLIRAGVRHLSELFTDFGLPDAQRCIAWLFGYASHVVADLTIHPVIELRVGPYEANQKEHRRCEMNQDAYIFQQKFEEDITKTDYLKHAGLEQCGVRLGDKHHLHPAVSGLWARILSEVPLQALTLKEHLPTPHHAPQPDEWHHHYVETIERASGELKWLFLVRGLAEDEALVYPRYKDVDMKYIKNLTTPAQAIANYDEIFHLAQENVIGVWRELASALMVGDPNLMALVNGDLDTGYADDAPAGARPIFWEA